MYTQILSSPARRTDLRRLYTPKLATVLREGYSLANLRADLMAGLTVAIVALPLSMAIAIGSHATPAQGLYTSIIGGSLVSALGGSRFQIGGPAGAFIVLVAATVDQHGMDGLILATILSGLILIGIGYLRLGAYIKFVPYPVTVGFTAGIAVTIFSGVIKPLLGLSFNGAEPGPLIEKIPFLWSKLSTLSPAAFGLSLASIAVVTALRFWRRRWPAMLIVVALGAAATAALNLPIETIGSQFGGVPRELPAPALPQFSLEKTLAVLPNAVSFALLGAIESLLSAVVADGMTGRRHRSNCELVGQGIANIASGLFGGFCVTGTVARTATNVRAGRTARSRGWRIRCSCSCSCWSRRRSLNSFRSQSSPRCSRWCAGTCSSGTPSPPFSGPRAETPPCFWRLSGITLFRGLTEGIVVGFALGSVLFIHRMSQTTALETHVPPVIQEDVADDGARAAYDEASQNDPTVIVLPDFRRILFRGRRRDIRTVLEQIGDAHRNLIIDFSAVPFVDSTGVRTIKGLAHKAALRGVGVYLTGVPPAVRKELSMQGVRPPLVRRALSIDKALAEIRSKGPRRTRGPPLHEERVGRRPVGTIVAVNVTAGSLVRRFPGSEKNA